MSIKVTGHEVNFFEHNPSEVQRTRRPPPVPRCLDAPTVCILSEYKREPLIDVYTTGVYDRGMGITILPKSPLGKWSTGSVAAFVVLLVVFLLLVASGQRGGETFFSNLVLTIPILLAGTSGVLAFVTGLISVIRNRERSILVFVAMLVGFLVLLFCVGEVVFPH